jgi:hypothetical protein
MIDAHRGRRSMPMPDRAWRIVRSADIPFEAPQDPSSRLVKKICFHNGQRAQSERPPRFSYHLSVSRELQRRVIEKWQIGRPATRIGQQGLDQQMIAGLARTEENFRRQRLSQRAGRTLDEAGQFKAWVNGTCQAGENPGFDLAERAVKEFEALEGCGRQ